MAEVVLDASALLALLNQEPGADVVAASLPEAVVSAVNLSEAVAKLIDLGIAADQALGGSGACGTRRHRVRFEPGAAGRRLARGNTPVGPRIR